MLAPFRSASSSLVVVGNINRDIKTSPFPPGDYLFADGETSIGGITESIGGGAAISAAVAAALGAKVSFLGQVGEDAVGEQAVNALIRAGVDCRVRRAPGLTTGTTVNLVYTTSARHFIGCHPNNRELAFDHLDLSNLASF